MQTMCDEISLIVVLSEKIKYETSDQAESDAKKLRKNLFSSNQAA